MPETNDICKLFNKAAGHCADVDPYLECNNVKKVRPCPSGSYIIAPNAFSSFAAGL